MDHRKRYIIDVEASGLQSESYPIEVAWCDIDTCCASSFLIKPARSWTVWDKKAEALHGLSRDLLFTIRASVR